MLIPMAFPVKIPKTLVAILQQFTQASTFQPMAVFTFMT